MLLTEIRTGGPMMHRGLRSLIDRGLRSLMRCLYELIDDPLARDTDDIEKRAGSHRSPLMKHAPESSCPSRESITLGEPIEVLRTRRSKLQANFTWENTSTTWSGTANPDATRYLRSLAAAVNAFGRWRSREADERRDFGCIARWLEMLPAARSEPLGSGAARRMKMA
jgi:hypothetical protein